jgi:hypothetical protein
MTSPRRVGRARPFVLLAAAVLLWGAAAAQPLVALPLEDILAGPIELSGLTSGSVTLLIDTTIDVACVVVFGTDEGFGSLALDETMDDGAHRDHRVVLRGLEPETDYVYRLQGSDPQGNFYVSETLAFRTPSAPPGADLGANVATLARGARILAVSSEFSDAWGATRAIDGQPNTAWSSQGDGDDAFITIELPTEVQVSGFGLWTRTMVSSAQIITFQVTTPAGQVFGPFEVPDASMLYAFPAEAFDRRFTFEVLSSSGGNTGAVEVAVFVRDAGPEPDGTTPGSPTDRPAGGM